MTRETDTPRPSGGDGARAAEERAGVAPTERPPALDPAGASSHGEDTPKWLGRVIDDRYRVVEKIGEGGMGSVFIAEHLKLHKQVALKVIHPELAGDKEMAARFAREAMASAKLEHPHVASALDYGTLPEGASYIVMQLVRGRSLQDVLADKKRLPWARACAIAAQVADALSAAHAAGIVHRDLKPDNVLLEARDDGSDLVKVLDFGIARLNVDERRAPGDAAPGKPLTRVGTVMGTAGYMAPEQAMGDTIDQRADLYALGVVLFQMITGKTPFGIDDLTRILTRQLTESAPGLRATAEDPSIPEALDALVAAMLARTASERPERAATVRDELRKLAFGTTGDVSIAGLASPPMPTVAAATAEHAVPAAPPAAFPAQSLRAITDAVGTLLPAKRRVPAAIAAVGCILPLALLGALVLVVAFTGGDESAQGGAPALVRELLPVPLQAAPAIPREVQDRIDVVLDQEDRRARREAADWLLAHRPESDVPDWARLVAEMETARGCRQRKQIVQRIGEGDHEEALPALQRIAASPETGCGFLGLRDCHSCMRRELGEIIRQLED